MSKKIKSTKKTKSTKSKYIRLSIDYIAKHIGEEITLYAGQPSDVEHPKDDELTKSTVIFLGDAFSRGKSENPTNIKHTYEDWFKKLKPLPENYEWFYLNTAWTQYSDKYHYFEFQVDSINKKYVSYDLLDIECYVKK